jgi:hypothetical protein
MSRLLTMAALLLAGVAIWAADERVGSGQAGPPTVAVVEGRVVDAATGQGLPRPANPSPAWRSVDDGCQGSVCRAASRRQPDSRATLWSAWTRRIRPLHIRSPWP